MSFEKWNLLIILPVFQNKKSKLFRACGSVGRAPPWHGGGQEFESPQVHMFYTEHIISSTKNI